MNEQMMDQFNGLISSCIERAAGDIVTGGGDFSIGDLAKLMAVMNESEKIQNEQERIKLDTLTLRHERINGIMSSCIKTAEIIIPSMVTVLLFNKGLKFEETGTVTSTFFKNLIHRIK